MGRGLSPLQRALLGEALRHHERDRGRTGGKRGVYVTHGVVRHGAFYRSGMAPPGPEDAEHWRVLGATTHPALSRAVARLERRGLVSRRLEGPYRQGVFALTPEGVALARRLRDPPAQGAPRAPGAS